MLDQGLKQQVQTLFEGLNHAYSIIISIREDDPQQNEMFRFLSDFASCSDKITVETVKSDKNEFHISKDHVAASVCFQAIPTGHEFSTLLLLVLNLDGKGKNFPDEATQNRIRNLKGNIQLRSFISLTCTNCPDVVQNLNMLSILNPAIRHTLTDGALFPEEAAKAGVQAVPSVFAEDTLLHVGRGSLGELVDKLEQKYGSNSIREEISISEQDVVVVGGGPAGVAAAVYAARKGLSVSLVAERIGGQVLETTVIENLISVPGTNGSKLGADLKSHLQEYPVCLMENRKVISITLEEGKKVVITSASEKLVAKAVIMATGAGWRRLNIPGENEYIGNGIAFCTHCDGPLYKGKKVVVVGGGNSGLEAAIDLAAMATEVTLIEFTDRLKGDQVLQEKLYSFKNVKVITEGSVNEIIGNGKKLTAVSYLDRKTGTLHQIDTDGVFLQIGLAPNSSLISGLVDTTPQGEIMIDTACRTNVPGIYAAGDVTTIPYKQIVVAIGEGAKAALSVFEDHLKGVLS